LLAKYDVRQPFVPVQKIAEGEGARIEKQDFEDDWSGFLLRGAGKPIIGVNKSHGVFRQRFTIAHELGHFLLHDGDQLHVDKSFRVNFRDDTSGLGTEVEERESNTFAAWLLMPSEFLRRDVRMEHLDLHGEEAVEELARRYRVSKQAMTFRLLNLAQHEG
jgi:Zn-dependent peptidase ImmA (M78 family)